MTRNTKIVLGVVAGLLVLCLCMGAAAAVTALISMNNRVIATAPEAAVRVDQVLSDPIFQEQAPLQYDMPSGWRQDFTFHIFGFQMIGLGGGDGHSHIYLLQLPPNRNADTAIKEAFDGVNTSHTTYRNGMILREVGQTTATIRGQQVTMKISEGTNRDHEAYRQWAGAASDANGQTVVVVEQPVQTWDQAMVDGFLASIK